MPHLLNSVREAARFGRSILPLWLYVSSVSGSAFSNRECPEPRLNPGGTTLNVSFTSARNSSSTTGNHLSEPIRPSSTCLRASAEFALAHSAAGFASLIPLMISVFSIGETKAITQVTDKKIIFLWVLSKMATFQPQALEQTARESGLSLRRVSQHGPVRISEREKNYELDHLDRSSRGL